MSATPDAFRALVREVVKEVVGEVLEEVLAARGLQPHGEFLSTAEASAYVKVTPDTLRRWKDAGLIQAHSAGRELRFRREDLDAFLGSRKRRGRTRKVSAQLSPEALAMRALGLDT